MVTNASTATRTSEFFRLLDAKDEEALHAIWAADPQVADEITRGWLRGQGALDEYMRDNLPRMTGIRSTVEEVDVRQWGDTEVETLVLRQSYVFEGASCTIEAPTTIIWRREGHSWKVALVHSIPLSTAP
jgi:hypothetical protein